MGYVYRYLRLGRPHETRFLALRQAFDRACDDLETEDAMPIEIANDEEIVFSSFDLYTMCDPYFDWKAGRGAHPLDALPM